MYDALKNEDVVAVLDNDGVAKWPRIPASQAPRASLYLLGAAGSEENREARGNQPVWVIRLTAAKGDGKSGTIVPSVDLMYFLEEQVSSLTPETFTALLVGHL